MAGEIISFKETLVSGGVGGTAIASPSILTADMFNNFVILGGTVGFWLSLGGACALAMVLVLNSRKIWTQIIKPLWVK